MLQTLPQAMATFAPALPFTVAFSGGADSTALLRACVQQWPGQVHALHVHHGLQDAADDFAAHCQWVCDAWSVPLTVLRVDASARPRQSPEDAARRARYQAFEALALQHPEQPAFQTVALAQHADDQVETLLLALSRGAGLPGLSAMPMHWMRAGITYHRPLLRVHGAELRAWLQSQGQGWIEDPTNTDQRFLRNRIRARLMPVLQQCFPQCRTTFARSATHAAQAQELLDEVGAQDLRQCGDPPRIAIMQSLSRPRLANLLRHWLLTRCQVPPSSAQLTQLMHQIMACQTRGHAIHLKVADGFCERQDECLHWYNPLVSSTNKTPPCP